MRIAMSIVRTLSAAVLLCATVASARADEAAPETPAAAAPAGQKGGGARAANAPSSAASAEQHKLPPDSVTKQTLGGCIATVQPDVGYNATTTASCTIAGQPVNAAVVTAVADNPGRRQDSLSRGPD